MDTRDLDARLRRAQETWSAPEGAAEFAPFALHPAGAAVIARGEAALGVRLPAGASRSMDPRIDACSRTKGWCS